MSKEKLILFIILDILTAFICALCICALVSHGEFPMAAKILLLCLLSTLSVLSLLSAIFFIKDYFSKEQV